MNKWLLPILFLMAGSAFADGSAPASPHRIARVSNTRYALIDRGSGDTMFIWTDTLTNQTWFRNGDNTALVFGDVVTILDLILGTGAGNAAYDETDVPTNGQQLTWNSGNTITWEAAGSGGSARWIDIGNADTSSLVGTSDTLTVMADTGTFTSIETENTSGFLFLDQVTIDGTKDSVQFQVRAFSSQTEEILRVELSDESEIFSIHADGTSHFTHTSTQDDEFSVLFNSNAAGFGGMKAIDIDFVTGNTAATEVGAGILINFDENAATGGDFFGIQVLTTTTGGAMVHGFSAGVGVIPIFQESGTFGNLTFAEKRGSGAYVDWVTNANTTATDEDLWITDNDSVFIGFATTFEELEWILATPATKDMFFNFSYSTGAGAWTSFSPIDGTNGTINNGIMAWDRNDLSGWSSESVDGDAAFWIVIVRTRNAATGPTEDLVQIADPTNYIWDESGNIIANSFRLQGTEDAFVHIITGIDATANRTFTFPDDELADLDILVGTGAGTFGYVPMTGDATMANTGVVTVVDDLHAHTTTSISGLDHSDITTGLTDDDHTQYLKESDTAAYTTNLEARMSDTADILRVEMVDSSLWTDDGNATGLDSTVLADRGDNDTVAVFTDDDAGGVVLAVGADQASFRIEADTIQMGAGNFFYYDTDAFKFNDRVVIEDAFSLTLEGGTIQDSADITSGAQMRFARGDNVTDQIFWVMDGADGATKNNQFYIGLAKGDSERVTLGVANADQMFFTNDGNLRKKAKAEADSNLVTASTVSDTADILRAEMGDTADVLRAEALWDSVAAASNVDSLVYIARNNDTGLIIVTNGTLDSIAIDFGQKDDPYVTIRNVDQIDIGGGKIIGVSNLGTKFLAGSGLSVSSITMSGDVTLSNGSVIIGNEKVQESDLDIDNTGSAGKVLKWQSGDKFTWATDDGGVWVYEAADQSILAWVNDSTGDTAIYFMDSALTIIDAGENIGFRFQDSVHAVKFTIPDAFDWTSGDTSVVDKGYVDSAIQSPTNLSIFGQMNIFGNLAVTNFENRLDMSAPILFRTTDWLGKDGINPLPTTLVDSTNNDQDSSLATHPSCLYYPMGWGADGNRKYRYLMAYTPLDAVADENPHFAVSNDGIIWQDSIWTGSSYDTIPTPIFDADDVGALHLSDGDIFFDKNGKLWIMVRAVHEFDAGNPFNQQLWVSGSDDGLAWDAPILIIDSAGGSGVLVQDSGILSPAVILDSSGVLKMFVVREEDTPGTDADTNEIAIYINPSGLADSVGGDGWQLDTILTEVNNDIVNIDSGQEIWHIEVIPRGADELLMLVTTAHSLDNTSGIGGLALATSGDGGYSWTKAECPAANCTEYYDSDIHAWDAPEGYHVSGWWKNKGNQTVLQAYGGTKREETSRWAIFRSEIHFQSTQDTTRIRSRYEFNQVYGVDSAWTEDTLTLEITNGNKIFKFKAISGGTDVDSLDVAMSCYIPDSFDCDSFVFVYESDVNAVASQFDSLAILVQGKTGPDLYPDSIALTYNTQQIAQVPTRVAIPFSYTFSPHELATVHFRISITDATRWVALHHAYLKGTSPNKPFARTPYDLRFLPAP